MSSSTKIDGFLWFPAAGLIISCLAGAFNAWAVAVILWLFIFSDSHDAGLIVVLLTVPSIIYLALLIVACWHFFRKKARTPTAMIAYYVGNFIINAGTVIFTWVYVGVSLDPPELLWLLSSSFSLIVLVPYFIYSRRVPIVFSR
jgi:hypothetical protein